MKRILAVVAAMLGLLWSTGYAAAAPPGDPAAQALGQAAASGQAAGAFRAPPESTGKPEHLGSCPQPRQRRRRLTIEHRQLECHGREREPHRPVGRTDPERLVRMRGRNTSDRPGCGQQPVRASTVVRHSEWRVEHQHPSPVLSPGNDGSVSQSNSVESDATAANANATGQAADQSSAGGSGTQAVGQSADNQQEAAAASGASQSGAKNTNISVRVLSPGDDGSVDQSNSVDSSATAANLNLTGQSADQAQGGGGTQAIGQDAKNDQDAAALSVAEQKGASNTNVRFGYSALVTAATSRSRTASARRRPLQT